MMMRKFNLILFSLLIIMAGCAGTKTFSTAVRPGDTVTIALGWNLPVTRSNIKIVFTQGANVVTYLPGDTRTRYVGNMYLDPAAKLIVGTETNQEMGVSAASTGALLAASVPAFDKDMAQTMIIVDTPSSFSAGTATLQVQDANSSVNIGPTMQVTLLAGVGVANTFDGASGALSAAMLASLERADSKTISFTGSTVPYAIQLEMTYTAGTPWLVNARGDLKNIIWTTVGGNRIKVMLLPTNQINPLAMSTFKFMVAGATGVAIDAPTVTAYDSNGNALSGIVAQIQ